MRLRRRRSVRLRLHDYRGGLCFVTICTHGRQPLFGHVADGAMCLSSFGRIANDEWARTAEVRPSVVLDAFVVMPDHAHLLFGIVPGGLEALPTTVGATRRVAPTDGRRPGLASGSVGAILGQYKSVVTKRIRAVDPAVRVWQRGFHDRVVRTDREAAALRRYVADNPARWDPAADRPDGHRL